VLTATPMPRKTSNKCEGTKKGSQPNHNFAHNFANDTERRVALVFAEVLCLQWVSPDDDIFTLGGDSFEAVRVALELEKRFQIEFPVERLEHAGRVRELAAWINTHSRATDPIDE
jgi:acyl carrier protein